MDRLFQAPEFLFNLPPDERDAGFTRRRRRNGFEDGANPAAGFMESWIERTTGVGMAAPGRGNADSKVMDAAHGKQAAPAWGEQVVVGGAVQH
jgi:hypothetical protein